MIAKIWKKVLFAILIIACLFNIIFKIVDKVPFLQEMQSAVSYVTTVDNTSENTTP